MSVMSYFGEKLSIKVGGVSARAKKNSFMYRLSGRTGGAEVAPKKRCPNALKKGTLGF